ncbi:uncharacterized protein LOC124613451 [Schistocerca americana]|uniref:uncharacterized protein LOC124613451 n=1 Tax=Schistocerca americana TaxID=7009 RepID=UPI001F4F95DE|nr:uncharacterized protein LOC124613451 [Schistocerca americana]
MSKEFLNTTDISDTFAGVPRKQKFVTNPTPSAVTRYVCISKEADGSSHSQPLAFWESVRNNDPVVTQHVCSFEESGSDISSSVASTNVVLKKHVAVIPADAIPAFPGFCSAERLNQKRYSQHEHVSHKQHPPAHIKSCREQQKSTRITPHTWREQVQIIKKEDAIAAAGGVNSIVTVSAVKLKDNIGSSVITKSVISEAEAQTTLTECISATNPGDIIIEKNIITSQRNDKEFHELDRGDLDVNEPEVLSADGNNAGTEKLATNIKVKSVGSMQRASTEVNDLKNADSEKKCTSDTPKRKLFHNRNKTREYILQQKQKRKERFATEQSKKNMEDEMKKVKLQTLREKSLRIVKTNVKKSLSKKRSPEKINNLGPDTAIDRNGKEDDLQTPDVAITMKSVTQKSVSVTKYKVTESIPSRDRLSAERDNDIDMAHNSSLPDSNGGNSNKSSSVDRELKGDQQIRNELDLKIRAVAKALSAELESNILHSSYDLTDKVTNDRNHLSLQRPLYRLRDTVCSRQPVTHNMENSSVVNTDSAIINISDSPPTKLKRYDHRKQMKSLEKKMELANNTISMLRENNIIKSFERSTREQAGSVKGPEKILKENSIELEKKSRQKTVDSPQQYFSKRSAFPFCPEQHSETTEKSRKLLKKRRIADKTNHVQNHSGTSTQTALNHVPQISMKYSPPTSPHISESGIIGKSENVQPQVRKHLDEVINLNCLPSSFPNNLQTIERNTHVTPVEQKKDPERRHERVKNRQTADDDYNKRSDRKSQLQTDMVTTHSDPVKDCEIKVQANEKLKKLLMQQAFEKDQYAANSPLTRDVTTRSSGAAAELFKRAVEHEKRERAATRIQALYRGHSTRKITDSLLIGTKSKSDVQQTQLQEEQHHNSTKKETWFKEDLSGSKLNTGEPTDWLELEPVKPCPYNVMTAVRQKLLALKVLDAKVETKTANICTDRTLAGDKSGIEGNNKSTLDQNKEVCTSGFWVEENAIVQTNTVAPATENKKKVQAVQLCSSKENSLSNAEGRSGNRKTSGSDKSYVFSEEAGWIENEEPEQKGIGSLHLSTVNKTNITQHSRNQGKTRESSAKSSIVGSDKEHSLTCSLRNNSESLSLPDVHLVRKRRSSENETVSIPSNSKEPYLSGVKERENSLPTSKADWIEASVHLSSPQTSFPSETNNRTKNNESETHYKKNITETKSDHSAKNSNNSKETMSSIDISDGGHAEKSSIQCTGTPLETETKKTGSSHSGSSANWSRNRHKFHKVLESGKMMPPEALHLQFQAEINLLESLEESRLRLAQIEGLHALSLIQHQNCPVTTQQKDEREQQVQVTSDHQQQRAPKQDKIDDFEKNRREFNTVIESMRRCATLSGVDPEIIDWLTFSDVSSPVKNAKKYNCATLISKSKYPQASVDWHVPTKVSEVPFLVWALDKFYCWHDHCVTLIHVALQTAE